MKSFSFLSACFCYLITTLFSNTLAQSCTNFTSEVMPLKCFEITSILFNSCGGTQEGENEMVTMKIGSQNLQVADFTVAPFVSGNVNWGSGSGSNPFRGICAFNGTTYSKVNQINASIRAAGNCGVLVPRSPGEQLPAGSNVLLITSTDFNPAVHSFSNLTDTLYLILQCSGNTTGHFSNTAARRLILSFGGAGGCSDTVTYYPTSNVDGDLALFQYDGTSVNVNNGCVVNGKPFSMDITSPGGNACAGDTLALRALPSGSGCFSWTCAVPAAGIFSDSVAVSTRFAVSGSFSGTLKFYARLRNSCEEAVDSVSFQISNGIQLVMAHDTFVCRGSTSIPLHPVISGTITTVKWSGGTGSFGNSGAAVTTYLPGTNDGPGTYLLLTLTGNCGRRTDSLRFDVLDAPLLTAGTTIFSCDTSQRFQMRPRLSFADSIAWNGGLGVFSDRHLDTTNYLRNPADKDSVYLKIFAGNTCGSITDSVLLVKGSLPTVFAGSDTALCGSAPLSLSGKVLSADSIAWKSSGSGNFSSKNNDTTVYTFAMSDSDTLLLRLEGSNGCGVVTDTLHIYRTQIPSADAGSDLSLCAGSDSVLLTGRTRFSANTIWSGGQGRFSVAMSDTTYYHFSPQDTGMYLMLSAFNRCGTVADSLQITRLRLPRAAISADTLVCSLSPVVLAAATSYATHITWQTTGSGSFVYTNDTAALYTPSVQDTGYIRFLLYAGNSCDTVGDTLLVHVVPPPDASFSMQDSVFCPYDPAVNLVPLQAGGVFSGTDVSGSTYTPQTAGTYYIYHVISLGGCRDSAARQVTVFPGPVADFTSLPLPVAPGKQVSFQYTGTPVLQYDWDFGNNTGSPLADPATVYPISGTYPVLLTVTNAQGCTDTITHYVVVFPEELFTVYNVFTPDGDQINDHFGATAAGMVSYRLTIWNRWSQQIFAAAHPDDWWDGTFNGEKCAAGTYYYIVECQGRSGKAFEYKGTVTLIR